MDSLTSKVKFVLIVFIGMISLMLIYDRVNYTNYIYHYVNKSVQNSIVINGNAYPNTAGNDIMVDNIQSRHSMTENNALHEVNNNDNSTDSYRSLVHNSNSSQTNDSYANQYNEVMQKILEFEAKHLTPPVASRTVNSRLLYRDVVRDITHMTLGDTPCDQRYGNGTEAVIVVISRTDGFAIRDTMRQTWAQPGLMAGRGVKVYYAIGGTDRADIQAKIQAESGQHEDVLQWDFRDDYYNLTLKSMAILRWVSTNCFNARHLYKVDDDCIVNTESLVDFTRHSLSGDTIYGKLWRNPFVDRNRKSKFFISRKDWKANKYPDYTGGPWLMAAALAPRLYRMAVQSLPALPWEDVYITGVAASKLGLKRAQLKGLVYFERGQFNKLNSCWFRENVIFWQNLDKTMIANAWANIVNTRDMVCLTKTGSTIYPTLAPKR